ncbi:DUF5333 domain-containing protein [Salipiger sp.]|uniref:DUF5333 domain-containing protein n=1 Tax=Salipiger sp. TaxID=2078585 RepID=UPI003A981AD8
MSLTKTAALVALLTAAAMPAAAAAKPPLRDVTEIHDGLMAVGIADEIRNKCNDIDARMLSALSYLNTLKNRAQALGYSYSEIDDYVTSKAEKKKMRADGEAFLRTKGVEPGDTRALCAFGRSEIDKGTAIGSLLRAK